MNFFVVFAGVKKGKSYAFAGLGHQHQIIIKNPNLLDELESFGYGFVKFVKDIVFQTT